MPQPARVTLDAQYFWPDQPQCRFRIITGCIISVAIFHKNNWDLGAYIYYTTQKFIATTRMRTCNECLLIIATWTDLLAILSNLQSWPEVCGTLLQIAIPE